MCTHAGVTHHTMHHACRGPRLSVWVPDHIFQSTVLAFPNISDTGNDVGPLTDMPISTVWRFRPRQVWVIDFRAGCLSA